MIKTLKHKFVKTAMTAVTALLLLFIVSVNAFNVFFTVRQNNQKLDAVSGDMFRREMRRRDDDYFPEIPDEDDEDDSGDDDLNERRELPERAPFFGISRDDAEGARFFKVHTDKQGNILSVEIDRISSVTQDEAEEYALTVLNTGRDSGRSGRFIYKITDDFSQGRVITFLDVSSDNGRIATVLIVSLGAGVLCWLLMLLLTSRVSDRAIKPIAENIERQKQFVSDAGHEIKTPLAVIRANAEAMELYNGESKWSKNIKDQVDRMSGLMQGLLQLSKSEEGIPESALETVSLTELSERAVSSFNEVAVSEGKSIKADIAPGVNAVSNSKALERIIDILLDNAVKYSSENSEINYTLSQSKKHCEIRVENKCDTLPECEPQKLFDRFYRADSSRNSEGFGIGLSSAKATAEALGGSLEAKYKDRNGIEFILQI
ncbi:MAG: HAMP domain-containing histidine kinase [Clostridia bacterium]|nr:HAMP domain-containing histidine kinase [Clostridia bacterium]